MIEYESLELSNRRFVAELRDVFDAVVAKGWYVLGKEVAEFEREFAAFVGGAHGIGVANGLDALILSLKALDLPAGSEVLVASNTYIATILAVVHAGHRPVLVEPDLRTYNIDPTRLAAALTPKTRAICLTHLYGKACRMDAIMPFAQAHGLAVVEDCAQSHGATLRGRGTGSFGHAGCFSFYPTKNLGALGDAGAVVTSDTALAERLRHLRNYGSLQKYVNVHVGFNSRLDELQAAFLRVKLRHLAEITAHKQKLAAQYFELLPAADLVLPLREPDAVDVFHIFAVRTPRRDELRAFLLAEGVKTEVHYPIPPHRQQAMQGILEGYYPIAEEIHATELSLPISFGTTADEVTEVCRLVRQFFASRTA
jgi:dTDP-4-amino-4,6-dideoxygalactose transaminase